MSGSTNAPQFWNKRAASTLTDWVTINPYTAWARVNANSTLELVSAANAPEGYVPGGGSCVKCSNTNYPTNNFAYSLTMDGTGGKTSAIDLVEEASFIEFPVYYPAPFNDTSSGIRFDIGSGGGLTNEYQKTFLPATNNARQGWNIYSYPLQALINGAVNTSVGMSKAAAPAINAMNFVRLLLTNAQTVWIGPIIYRRKSRPTITLSFDDGLMTTYTNSLPLLQARGMTATAFIISQRPGNAAVSDTSGNYMSWSHIAALKTAGWDIQCHSRTHANQRLGNGGGMSDSDIYSEVVGAWQDMLAQGYNTKFYAWPGGGYTEVSKSAARIAGFNLCYSLGNDFDKVPFAWGSGDYGDIRRINTDNGNYQTCIYYINEAIRLGTNLHIYTHDVGASASGPTYTNITEYTTILDTLLGYRRQGLCDVTNINSYWDQAFAGRLNA